MAPRLFRLFAILWLACVPIKAGGQQSRVSITIQTPGQARVAVELASPSHSWSFRNVYAGILGIAERIEEFRAFRNSGEDVPVRKLAAGEFRSDLAATRISYRVRLSEPRAAGVAHISWVVADRGFLMFADLLPIDLDRISAEFALPSSWSIASSIGPQANGRYETSEPEDAVFLVGGSLRERAKNVAGMSVVAVVDGNWSFKDSEVLNAAATVMKKYWELTGFRLPRKSVIMIAPLPVQEAGSTTWKAETRGSTIILLMDPNARVQNWKGQLGIIFTHELLHLWVPNALKLEGDYDWFFEGFTLYTALRTALELKIISFAEFLNTLARVYDASLSYSEDSSLVEASEKRWTSHGRLVYDKGMLVAFLYDLMIRKESMGKLTLAARYRDLFNGGVADHAQANEAIINLLGSSPSLKDFTKSYVESSRRLELEQFLPAYGLEVNSDGTSSQLRVGRDLDADQKRLLRSLGYRG